MNARTRKRTIATLLTLFLTLGLFVSAPFGATARANEPTIVPLLVESVSGDPLTEGTDGSPEDYYWLLQNGSGWQLYITSNKAVTVTQNPAFTAANNCGLAVYIETASAVTFDSIITSDGGGELYDYLGIVIQYPETDITIKNCHFTCPQFGFAETYIYAGDEDCSLTIKNTRFQASSLDETSALKVSDTGLSLTLEDVTSGEMFCFQTGYTVITLKGTNSITQGRPASGVREHELWNAMRILDRASVTIAESSTGSLSLTSYGATALGGTSTPSSTGNDHNMGSLTVKGGRLTTYSYADKNENTDGFGIGAGAAEYVKKGTTRGIVITGGTVDANSDTLARIGGKRAVSNDEEAAFANDFAIKQGYTDLDAAIATFEAGCTCDYNGACDACKALADFFAEIMEALEIAMPAITITGGSVVAKGVVGEDDTGDSASHVGYLASRPRNADGEPLYLVKHKAANVTTPTLVTSLSVTRSDGTAYPYGITGMYTDNEGYVYVWVPGGATVEGGPGGGNGGSYPILDFSPTETTPDSNILIDGKPVDAGTTTVDKDTGSATTEINQTIFEKQLENGNETVQIILPDAAENEDISSVTAQLVVKNIEDMAKKSMTLSVESGGVAYNLPTEAVDTAAIMAELGIDDPSLASVSITITPIVSDAVLAAVEAAVGEENIVFPPMQFEVTASYDGKTVVVEGFSNYVPRTIEISAEQAARITTAVIIDEDGSSRHVPTNVYEKDGKWYAEIFSLTNSVYVLIYNESNFTDISGKWYEPFAQEMGDRKMISGYPDGSFGGDNPITRAEFAQILVNALGLPTDGDGTVFSDISATAWYAGSIGTAFEYSLVSGRGDGIFDPEAEITRQEAMIMIQRAARLAALQAATDDLSGFSDANQVADWALDAVSFCVGSGLVGGYDGKVMPTDSISRAETAKLVLRLLQEAELVDKRS